MNSAAQARGHNELDDNMVNFFTLQDNASNL